MNWPHRDYAIAILVHNDLIGGRNRIQEVIYTLEWLICL